VMTFVINLAVPPLLLRRCSMARDLYEHVADRALLDFDYRPADADLLAALPFHRAAGGGQIGLVGGLSAWLLAGSIAQLLSTNMTLMLRPEVWRGMYSASAMGAYLPPATRHSSALAV